jgi:signal transduction histidine kinase
MRTSFWLYGTTGIGFRESDLSNTLGSLGLLGMKEREQFCGGEVQISSSPGNGTTVTVRVPVDTPCAERNQATPNLPAAP